MQLAMSSADPSVQLAYSAMFLAFCCPLKSNAHGERADPDWPIP